MQRIGFLELMKIFYDKNSESWVFAETEEKALEIFIGQEDYEGKPIILELSMETVFKFKFDDNWRNAKNEIGISMSFDNFNQIRGNTEGFFASANY